MHFFISTVTRTLVKTFVPSKGCKRFYSGETLPRIEGLLDYLSQACRASQRFLWFTLSFLANLLHEIWPGFLKVTHLIISHPPSFSCVCAWCFYKCGDKLDSGLIQNLWEETKDIWFLTALLYWMRWIACSFPIHSN